MSEFISANWQYLLLAFGSALNIFCSLKGKKTIMEQCIMPNIVDEDLSTMYQYHTQEAERYKQLLSERNNSVKN